MPKARKAVMSLKLTEVCLWNTSRVQPYQKRLFSLFRGVTEKHFPTC